MKTSQHGLEFITDHEGTVLHTYKDAVGILTIGVGHTGPDVKAGMTISRERAMELLADDVYEAEHSVNTLVRVPLNQNQFDALVSFVFNVGGSAFGKSTLLKKLNAGDYEGASKEFSRWNKAGGRELLGLTKRRLAEARLFNSEYL